MTDYDQLAQQLPAEPANPYDALLQKDAAQEAQSAVAQVADRNPETEAKLQSLANRYNLPVEAVRIEQPRIERRAAIDDIDYDRLAADSPTTASFIGDPRHAALALDDTANMGLIETTINSFQRGLIGLRTLPSNLQIANISAGLSQLDYVDQTHAAGGQVDPSKLGLMGEHYLSLSPEQRQQFRQSYQARMQSQLNQAAGVAAGANVERGNYPSPDSVNRAMAPTTPWTEALGIMLSNPLDTLLSIGPESLVVTAPGLAVAPFMGPVGGAVAIGLNSAVADFSSNIIERLQAAGVDATSPDAIIAATQNAELMNQITEAASARAAVVGGVDAATGGLASKLVLPRAIATRLASRPIATELANLAAQTGVQAAAGATGEAGGQLAAGDELQGNQVLAEAFGELFTGPAEVAAIAGRTMVQRARQAQAAQQNAQALDQLNQAVTASQVLQRDPETFQRFIDKASENGPVSDVYIDLNQLAQSGIDPAALAQVSPAFAAQLPEAQATGNLIKVPVSEYAARIAPSELAQPLVDIIKTDPLGMSRREAEEFFQTQGDQLKAEVESLLTDKQQDDTFKASRDVVFNNVLQQLTQANRFTEDVNRPYATLMSNFYAVQAARMGVTPEQMFQQHPVQIAAEAMQGAALDQKTGETLLDLRARIVDNPDFGSPGMLGVSEMGNGTVLLNAIEVPSANRGQGHGSKIMQELTRWADTNGKRVELSPSIDFGATSVARLKKFYKRFGFVENKGRNKDFTTRETMYREPQQPTNTFDQEANGSTPYTEPTITVDGKERPTTNSNGKPIAATKEGLENFWRWFGDSKVVDADGKPLVVYHGTTGDFSTFDLSKASVESDLGAGFYFTNSVDDVAPNYAGTGPDLKNKIERRAEQLANERDLPYDDPGVRAEVEAQLKANGGNTMPVYVRMVNPAILGGDTPTTLDFEETYDEETEEYGEPTGKLLELGEAITAIAEGYSDADIPSLQQVLSELYSEAMDSDGVNVEEVVRRLKSQEAGMAYLGDDGGDMVVSELVRQAFEQIGFDGFEDHTPSAKFTSMAGLDEDTVHYIAFGPNQIKSATGNNGNFSREDNNILHQPAYHGSPHRFEKFDLSKIGTGEGAQVQGWGLYFAEREGVARSYFESLGGADRPIQRIMLGSLAFGESNGFDYTRKASGSTLENIRVSLAEDILTEQTAMIEAADKGEFDKFVLDTLDAKIERYKGEDYPEGVREAEKLRQMLARPGGLSIKLGDPTGNLYKLDIPDEAQARMLDWDAPLSEQPERVKEALASEWGDAKTGEDFYKRLEEGRGKKGASEYLASLGIPGNNYWDGQSRGVAGKVTNWRVTKYANEGVYLLTGDNARTGGRIAEKFYTRADIEAVVGKERLDQALAYAKDNVGQQMEFAEGIEVKGHRNIVVWDQSVLDQINENVDTLYQSADTDPDASPWYYSQVAKVVENIKMSKAQGEQWLKTIQNTPGVKQEEIDWMGLPEWLNAQKGSIAKADLLAFIEANQITVDEVVKGGVDYSGIYFLEGGSVAPYSGQDIDGTNNVAIRAGSGEEALQKAQEYDAGTYEGNDVFVSKDDLDTEVGDGASSTKFSQYVLPGGENYRELMMTLPGNDYRSSHFDERNIVAHLRFNERTDADGKRVLFIEEIQSDWHQQGRDKGYRQKREIADLVVERNSIDEKLSAIDEAEKSAADPSLLAALDDAIASGNMAEFHRINNLLLDVSNGRGRDDMVERRRVLQNQIDRLEVAQTGVPDAPFKTTWPELAFKRALRWAVDNGFDRVAWTTGEQQADRYDLSKQVKSIAVPMVNENSRSVRIDALEGTSFKLMVDNKGVVDSSYSGGQFSGKTLDEVVGKDMADKIMKLTGPAEFSGLDLKVGGEGMRTFYDKMLPSMVNKMVKKWGGKVGETSLGSEGMSRNDEYTVYGTEEDGFFVAKVDASGDLGADVEGPFTDEIDAEAAKERIVNAREMKDGLAVHSLDITPDMRAAAKAGLALFQEKRGAFNPSTSTITLLKAADLSTFLHESGHFFLETMNKLALDPNAPADIKSDMDIVFKWFGVTGLTEWNGMSLGQQRENHEKFARGFEAYLFEGKAPSVELRGVFQKFRAWLLNVYRSLAGLKVELNDDVRGVFDRMLATTDQIKEAEAARSMLPMFVTAKDAGMTPEEFKAYYDTGLEATQEAVDNLQTRSLRDMKWLDNAKGAALKKLQKDAAARRRAVRDEVTREVLAEPVNQARQFLKRGLVNGEKVDGPHKLHLPEMRAAYQLAPESWFKDNFGYGAYGMLSEDGIHPDQVAEMFGFGSGDEMVQAILNAEDPKAKIEGMTDQRMLERYGDLNSPEDIENAANAAIHNDARTRFVATELNALQKALGSKKILAKAAKDYAATMVNRQLIRELKPSRYEAAEARAAKASAEAFKKGDIQTAAAEKKNQLVQTYAAKAAYEAADDIAKGAEYLKKFTRDSIRKSIDPDYVDQIQALLERFDLKERTLKDIDRRKSLAEWVAKQEEMGIEPDIDPAVLNEANRKNYKEMTVEEFKGLIDTIKQIEHLGRLKTKLLTAADDRNFDAAVARMVARANETAGGAPPVDNTTPNTRLGLLKLGFKSFFAAHRKMANYMRNLDGWQDGGPFFQTFLRSMNDAGNREATMRAQATKKLAALVAPVLEQQGKMGGKGVYFPTLGRSLNREARISVALNAGNAGNLQRLLGGEGWTMERIAPVLQSITPEEATFVQSIWDFFEEYRPLIGAKERRVYGKEPEWVEPQPITLGGKQLRGGYYPIKYDARRSLAAEQHADAESAKAMMKGAYTSATTRRSFTKSRAEEVVGRPLMYSMDGIFQGTNEVIHDLSWHEWLIDVNRLLSSKLLDGAIRNRFGADYAKQIKSTVQDIAAGEHQTSHALDKVLNHMRIGTSIAGLGLNVVNAVVNLTGLSQSVVRIGAPWVMQGVSAWVNSPIELTRIVHEKSGLMRNRALTFNREVNEVLSMVRGQTKLRRVVDVLMYAPLMYTQLAVDTPTWWGAYQKALHADPANDASAVAQADQAVLDAQSGGQVKDLAAVQRGGAAYKLFTTFYGYFSSTYNLSVEVTKKTNFKDPADVLRLAGDYLVLYAVPAVLGTLIKAALTGDDDLEDPEKLARRLANDGLSYMMGTVVGMREITGAAQTLAGVNQYGMAYGGPAGLRFLGELDKLAKQIAQGEPDRALFRAGVNVGGITLHLPSGQINRTVDGIAALAEGRTSNPLAVLSGAPPK